MTKPRGRPWPKGVSGNAAGRPRGPGETGKMRAALGERLAEVIAAVVARALDGDMQAARLVLERVLPALRPVEPAQAVTLPGETLTEQGRAVLAAVASGNLAPGQGAALMGALGTLAKLTETDTLDQRIAALEMAQARREGSG